MVAEVGWLSALFLVPLIVLPSDPDPFVHPKLAVLLVAAVLVAVGVRHRPFDTIDTTVFVFVGVYALATALSVDRWRSFVGEYGRGRGLVTIVACAMLYWGLRTANKDQRSRAIAMMLLSGTMVAVWTLYAAAVSETPRISGTQGNAIFLGAALLAPAIIAAAYVKQSWYMLPLSGLLALAVVLTRSRGPMLALAVGVLMVSSPTVRWLVVVVGALIMGYVVNFRGIFHMDRFAVWYVAAQEYMAGGFKEWLIGSGPDTFSTTWNAYPDRRLDSAHSVPLQLLLTTGVAGLVAWGALWDNALRRQLQPTPLRYEWSVPVLAALTVESVFGIATVTSLMMLFGVLGVSR